MGLTGARGGEGRAAKSRDAARSRRVLITAGTDLFALRGFDGVTTEQIARAAGVNKALINYHFGGKSGLYTAILILVFSEVAAHLDRIERSEKPAMDRLEEFVSAFADMHGRHPAFSAMLLREVVSGGRHLDDRVLPHFLAIFTRVRGVVADGIRDGSIRCVDPLLTHLGLIGSVVFFFATKPLRDRLIAERKVPFGEPDPQAFVRHLQDLISRGLAPGPP